MEFAEKAGVRNLVLFHHDPYHTDDQLEEVLEEARKNWPLANERVSLASEGMTITFDAEGAQLVAR
jgi:ribonuclease BN (tRNA processing enzyme)